MGARRRDVRAAILCAIVFATQACGESATQRNEDVVDRLRVQSTTPQGQVADGSADEQQAPQGDVVDRMPDLRMAPLYGFSLETTASGRTRLRFGTIGWNVGQGPLEVHGMRFEPDDTAMRVKQRIFNSAGGFRDRVTSAVMVYDLGDGHDHWHVRQFIHVEMYRRGRPNANVFSLRKIGYCLIDAARMPSPPPGAPPQPVYRRSTGACGTGSSTTLRAGLSVGYGDDYPPDYAHQWMDVTGLQAADFRLCATVDALDDFAEMREDNNQRWTDVRIDLAANSVVVLTSGMGTCGRRVQ